jgi:hypothetical protein
MGQADRSESFVSRLGSRSRELIEVIPFVRRERRPSEASPLALARLIEGEIIPRLLLAHQGAAGPSSADANGQHLTAVDVTRFVRMVLVEELDTLLWHVDGLIDRGASIETILFDLLSPAAKQLGVMWEEDHCSFTDVTVGLCRLQQIVYDLGDRTPATVRPVEPRSALFALTPGDQHSFGLVLVVEVFRQAGWQTVTAPDATAAELVNTVSSQSFDLVGFSMAIASGLRLCRPSSPRFAPHPATRRSG